MEKFRRIFCKRKQNTQAPHIRMSKIVPKDPITLMPNVLTKWSIDKITSFKYMWIVYLKRWKHMRR
jgi:hypothetical protein